MAVTDEQSRWNEWNDGVENRAASGSIDYVDDIMETFDSNDDPPRRTSFCQKIQPPQVSHIEQAERLTVHSCLHHHSVIPSSSAEQSDNSSGGNQPSNDFSHLPAPHENNVVCLWMTNVLELLDLTERHLDRKCMCANEQNCKCQLRPGRGKFYGDMHPYRPLQLPDLNVVNEIWNDMENKMSDSLYSEEVSNDDPNHGASPKSQSAWSRIVESANPHPDPATPTNPIEQHQLAFSFRANLPPDIPPTMSAECVKYFYSVVLVVTTVDGKLLVSHCPFTVLTSDSRHSNQQQSSQPTSVTRVHIGNLCAIAHSTALPTYITSTEASNATSSKLTLVTSCRDVPEQRTSTHRIEDGKGRLCAMMTLVGIGGPLTPGTRLGIRIQFPISDGDETGDGVGVIPCHRVCCALVGEEYAVHEVSGGDNPSKGKKRVKTRNYVFDSAYEMVEFGYTEAISMGLVLPLNCPVTVKTDLVEVSVTFKVEFTVRSTNEINSDAGLEVIRLDLPCEVVHDHEASDKYNGDGNAEEAHATSIGMQNFWKPNHDMHAEGVDDIGIQSELNVLSIRMIGLYLNRG
ncbi:hypothetical protein ACHAWU_008257 [Discostella pseudostelligera]|uniref:Uncharacterized protein n=1 Tax=Discostella pseudostelligera TaxID=259834 RepID=A0ABD3M450_9STRA